MSDDRHHRNCSYCTESLTKCLSQFVRLKRFVYGVVASAVVCMIRQMAPLTGCVAVRTWIVGLEIQPREMAVSTDAGELHSEQFCLGLVVVIHQVTLYECRYRCFRLDAAHLTLPTYSPFPVVMILVYILTLMTYNGISSRSCCLGCRQSLSRGVVHRRVGQMDVQQSA